MSKNITSIECRFITHLPKTNHHPDVHFIKKLITYEDGTYDSVIEKKDHYLRPVWITLPQYRTHKYKKEYEDLSKLELIKTTQSDLAKVVCQKLKITPKHPYHPTLHDIRDHPYVYGIDVSTESLIKKWFKDRHPVESSTPFSIAALDIEADITTDTITVISISTYKTIFVAVLEDFIRTDLDTLQSRLHSLWRESVPDTEDTRDIQFLIKICSTETEVLEETFSYIHTLRPDFLAIWNMRYDIHHIVSRYQALGLDPKDLFSDPSIPKHYRHFEFVEDTAQKVTVSGVVTNKAPYQLWDHVLTPSSYYCIDAMQAFYRARLNQPKFQGGYSLDNVLEKILGVEYKKLKFTHLGAIDHMVGVDWHRAMSKNHPIEYTVYNMWDTYSMILLDRKTHDLSLSIPSSVSDSSLRVLHKQPKLLADAIHHFYIENHQVMSCKSNKIIDYKLLGLSDWIITAESYKVKPYTGLQALEEAEHVYTNIRHLVCDADQVSGYPSDTLASNASIATLQSELQWIEGKERSTIIKQDINYLFGKTHSIEYMVHMYQAPTLRELLTGEILEHTVQTPSRAEEYEKLIHSLEGDEVKMTPVEETDEDDDEISW